MATAWVMFVTRPPQAEDLARRRYFSLARLLSPRSLPVPTKIHNKESRRFTTQPMASDHTR
jgi:hypothetical protein